jgi:hypothetical protein
MAGEFDQSIYLSAQFKNGSIPWLNYFLQFLFFFFLAGHANSIEHSCVAHLYNNNSIEQWLTNSGLGL